MKTNHLSTCLLATLLAAPAAFAVDYYYDGNDATAGFGAAAGTTWAAPTPGPLTGWSTDSTGASAIGSVTTSTNDLLNFGTDTAALGTGTITVSGTVESGNMRFAATTPAITLSGGKIVFTNDAIIEFANATPVNHTISSEIAGAASSLTKTGVGSLILTGSNSYSGVTIISAGSISMGNVNCLSSTAGITIGGSSAATLAGFGDVSGVIIPGQITLADSGINSTIIFGRNTANSGTLTLNGGITGAGNVVFQCPSANGSNGGQVQFIELGAASTYQGNTTITSQSAANQFVNTIRAGVVNALPVTTLLRFAGNAGAGTGRASTYDLNGFNQTVSGLNNNNVPNLRNYIVTSATAATLTISNTTDYAFGGAALSGGNTSRARIQGAIALTKDGSGTFMLGGIRSGGAAVQGNTFTGDTKILAGILVLGETISIQNSVFDTANSIAGNASNGLRITNTVTSITLGGLSGNKNLADVFTTTDGGFSGLAALTLNPGLGFTPSYSGAIADGAAGMSLIKTGAGTQTLTGGNTWTGATIVRAGKLAVTTIPTGLGTLTVTNSSILAVTAGGSSWSPASLTVNTCTLEFNNASTTTAVIAPAATVATPVTNVTVNVNSLAGSPIVGSQYILISNVTAATGYSLGLQPPGFAGSLVIVANTLRYQVDSINDIWSGVDATNPTFWNIGLSTNWVGNGLLNSPSGSYAQNDAVLFDDTATTFAVAIQTLVTPNGVNFNNTTNAYTLSSSGTNVIGGANGLSKLGTNKVTLLGGNHSFSGPTTISTGTLQLGDGAGGNDSALTNTSGVLNNSALIYNLAGNHSASYPITGNGTVTKDGAGTMTLLGTNTYIGVTTINGGALEIAGSGSLNNGNYAGNIANNGTLIYSSSAAQTLGGSISGIGAVTKSGVSTLTLGNVNSFSGQLTVENGTVAIASAVNDASGGSFGDSSLPVILGASGNTGTVRFTGTLGNYFNSKKFTMATGGSGGFQINNSSTTFHLSGVINGSGGLIKSGPGTLNLTAANTYTGDTAVNNGTLAIQVGSIATNSTVSITTNGVLNLGFATTNLITALVVDGTNVANGVYSSANLAPFLAGTGSLQIGNLGPSGPAILTNSVSGNTLSLSWPAGEGWRLEQQTNTLAVGISTNWVQAADSSVSSTNITIDPAIPTVFYRLVYP